MRSEACCLSCLWDELDVHPIARQRKWFEGVGVEHRDAVAHRPRGTAVGVVRIAERLPGAVVVEHQTVGVRHIGIQLWRRQRPYVEPIAERSTPIVRHAEVCQLRVCVVIVIVQQRQQQQGLNLFAHLLSHQRCGIGTPGTHQQGQCLRQLHVAVGLPINERHGRKRRVGIRVQHVSIDVRQISHLVIVEHGRGDALWLARVEEDGLPAVSHGRSHAARSSRRAVRG